MYKENLKNINSIISEFQSFKLLKNNADTDLVLDALQYFDKSEKFDDLLEISKILSEETEFGTTVIIPLILHLSNAYKNLSEDKIQKQFGKTTFRIVEGLYKISFIKTGKASMHSENFRKLFLSLSGDVRVILIKLAEQLYSIRKFADFDEKQQKSILETTKLIYVPIAHRLGLYNLKSELEELWLRNAKAEIYSLIKQKLAQTFLASKKYIHTFIEPIKSALINQGFECQIIGRPKSIHSIHKKMNQKQVGFDEVYDLFAIRVVLMKSVETEKADCWKIYSVVTNIYKPMPSRLRDWISFPRKSGYESLHTTVLGQENKWVEVQIRTKRMDNIAEKGDAAHWKYKEDKTEKNEDDALSIIRQWIEKSDADIDNVSEMQLYGQDIFVFTPKGELKKLPKQSSVLDFAFYVHSKVGENCVGAVVNEKNVPIKHTLQNGDEVRIITSKNQKPRTHWLEIVKSPRVKQKIKRALKYQNNEKILLGKNLLSKKLKQLKLDFSDKNISKIQNAAKQKSTIDLYIDIADEKFDIKDVAKVFVKKIAKKNLTQNEKINYKEQENYTAEPLLINENAYLSDYKLSKCCQPSFGNKIFGFVTVEKGIKIHTENCPNARQMKSRFSYRVIPARWIKEKEGSCQKHNIRIVGKDKKGILIHITTLVTNQLNLNIISTEFRTNKGRFEGEFAVYITNQRQLSFLLKKLKAIDGVEKVNAKGKI